MRLIDDVPQLTEEPVSAPNGRGARYRVYGSHANGQRFYTVTEDGVPVADYLTLQAAEKEAVTLEREAKAIRHGQFARHEEVLA